MNNIERDLRRRLKKSIKKRRELNDRCQKYKETIDKAINKLGRYADIVNDANAYVICVDLLDILKRR